MGSKKKGINLFTWILIASLEILIVLLFVSSDYMRKNSEIETSRVQTTLGEGVVKEIEARADVLYQTLVIEPDLEGWIRKLYIPTQEEKERSVGLQRLGEDQGVWSWAESRLEAFLDMLYWIFKRVSLFAIWVPIWIPAFLIAIRLGWLERAIKKTNFSYTSPFLLGMAKRSIGFVLFVLITMFVIPIALYPVFVPILFAICVLLLGFAVGHVQKRI